MRLAILDVTYADDPHVGCHASEDDAATCEHRPFPAWAAIPGDWRETSSMEDRTHKYVAEMTPDQYAAFSSDWGLSDATNEPNLGTLSEYGWQDADAYNFDGMDWNAGGWTPVEYVTLYVSEV